MNGIYNINDASFPFDQLMLTPPTIIAGGNHFIKYSVNGSPLYIQPPKCLTRGTIAKSNKRAHCDLMFSNQDIHLIKWMEDLEAHTCKQIYENRAKWFESDMELSDIENYFASPLKLYKSGKNYLTRANIPTRLGKINLKIYNENEEEVDPETIADNTNIVTILEVQGIKCSARSFQIEFDMKQMLTLSPVDIFEKCIIVSKSSGSSLAAVGLTLDEGKNERLNVEIVNQRSLVDTIDGSVDENVGEAKRAAVFGMNSEDVSRRSSKHTLNNNVIDENVDQSNQSAVYGLNSKDSNKIAGDQNTDVNGSVPYNTFANLDIKSNMSQTDSDPFSELHQYEMDLNLEDIPETENVTIKSRNDVYYELYKEARKKARISRNLALQSYLEAKEIKTKYDLDDIESDEEDRFFNNILDADSAAH